MMTRRLLWVLLPLFLVACSDDNSTVQPPVPLTPDEQVVADCLAIQDALENYAASHGGLYGEWDFPNLGLARMENPYTGEVAPERVRAAYPGQIGLEAYRLCDGSVAGYRLTGHGKDHMLITLESLANVPAEVLYAHDVTVANALLVLDTVQRWAAAHNGEYSTDVAGDTNADGKTLVDLLPNGELLINPSDGWKSNPQDGLGLGYAGGIGYIGSDSGGSGTIDSFTIEAYDCGGGYLLIFSSYSEGEDRVMGQSNLLRDAVEAFKQSNGHYPHNLDTETTPDGKTVSELYFENATHQFTKFVNPYTGDHRFAFVGTAVNKGEIAYQPIETAGVVTDYVITARGLMNEIVHLGPTP